MKRLWCWLWHRKWPSLERNEQVWGTGGWNAQCNVCGLEYYQKD